MKRRFFTILLLSLFLSFAFSLVFSLSSSAQEPQKSAVPVDEDLFVLVSDVHIHQEPVEGGGKRMFNTVTDFKTCVQNVLKMNPRPAAVIFFGDLQHIGLSDEPYEMFRELLKPWDEAGIPYYLTLGNHDQPGRFFRVFPEWKDRMAAESSAWAKDFKHVGFIVFETTDYSNGWYGLIPEKQKLWYEKQLENRTLPVFVCGHHDWELMRVKPEMTNPAIQGWMCGHRHDFVTKIYPDGVRELRVPSTGHTHAPSNGYLLMKVEENGYRFTFVALQKDSELDGKEIFLEKK